MTQNNKNKDTTSSSQNFLIRGSDYVGKHEDFKLVGRDDELKRLFGMLTRSQANNVLMVGPGGVGCTALCMGLQASKEDMNTPFDIVSKRFFWLDSDGLFASGKNGEINEEFQKILRTLSRSPDTVLIVEDTRDFLEAAQNSGNTHLINALMRDARNGKFQIVFETRDEDLESVLKCHSDMREFFTLLDVKEPVADALREIVDNGLTRLEKHHGIRIAPEAVDAAIELTNKYRVGDMGLSRAQPERTMTLLDRALTTYRLHAHARPGGLDELEANLSAVNDALTKEIISSALAPTLEGKSKEEIESLRAVIESDIHEMMDDWETRQKTLRSLYKDQRTAEEAIRELEDQLEQQKEREAEARATSIDGSNTESEAEHKKQIEAILKQTTAGGFESEAMRALRNDIKAFQADAAENKKKYDVLRNEINDKLSLDKEHIYNEFSTISSIAVNKLTQDEKAKLLKLEDSLSNRVFSQDKAITKLSNAIQVAKTGLQEPNKPQASFLFLGPSGVGKTELAKALTETLFDEERAMFRFDMSEYMEKHAVAKLIGAPPGYEGYEAGGILTNKVRRNPNCVILFDEIEKADVSVFDIFLQILDDARLTDNRGLTVSFKDTIILMTSNMGGKNFLDDTLTVEEAEEMALEELAAKCRPEFLNRFNGRENIVALNKLDLPTIEKIASRELEKLNKMIAAQGLEVQMLPVDLAAMCKDKYNPVHGARGITGYIAAGVKPGIAKTILHTPDAKGVMVAKYNQETKEVSIDPPKPKAPAPSNENAPDKISQSATDAFKIA